MMRELRAWNALRVRDGKLAVDIGIGLNTDQVVSGNIGSKKRMDYTIIGDGVNLAARLESACKQYGAHILISEFTYRALRGTYRMRELDYVVVQGKTKPVSVYEVLDYHSEDSYPNLIDAMGLFRNGLINYRQRKWAAAHKLFEEVLALNPGDKAAAMYVERCQRLAAEPPPDDWDGTYIMQSK
jgi:adenylate cyclase